MSGFLRFAGAVLILVGVVAGFFLMFEGGGVGIISGLSTAFSAAVSGCMAIGMGELLDRPDYVVPSGGSNHSSFSNLSSETKKPSAPKAPAKGKVEVKQSAIYRENTALILPSVNIELVEKKLQKKDGKVVAKFVFVNKSPNTITAVLAGFSGTDAFGNVLTDLPDHQYLDFEAKNGDAFGEEDVDLQSSVIRHVDVSIKKVLLSDGTIIDVQGESWQEEEKPAFNWSIHMDKIRACKTSAQICAYLKRIDNLPMDFKNDVMPKIQEMADVERMYGNSKESTMKLIDEFIG